MDYTSKTNYLTFKLTKGLIGFNSRLSSSKLLTKLIFGFDVIPYHHQNCQNWDLSTLILKKALDIYVKDNQKILEVGTGHLAILSIYIAKKKEVYVTAIDINPVYIENAKKNAKKNRVSINLIHSDLFAKIDGRFDIIFFNPPYVTREWMLKNNKELCTDSIFDLTWKGGPHGCDTIKRFLNNVESFTHCKSRIFLGVNSFFIDITKMKKIIQENNLILDRIISSLWNPSKTYVIKKGGTKCQ
ncbi:MAG: methyltransferase [Thermoplasmatales archaeon]|nr:MAG: methyltransferase [Thermoplasmatales archaeon]